MDIRLFSMQSLNCRVGTAHRSAFWWAVPTLRRSTPYELIVIFYMITEFFTQVNKQKSD